MSLLGIFLGDGRTVRPKWEICRFRSVTFSEKEMLWLTNFESLASTSIVFNGGVLILHPFFI
ncbi:hypothetical protein LguiA_021626 [Lonicera macranthoides]